MVAFSGRTVVPPNLLFEKLNSIANEKKLFLKHDLYFTLEGRGLLLPVAKWAITICIDNISAGDVRVKLTALDVGNREMAIQMCEYIQSKINLIDFTRRIQ